MLLFAVVENVIKGDKLRRIKNSACDLFLERNYDQATTREIALRAGVAPGTLFTHLFDKCDVLSLIFTAARTNCGVGLAKRSPLRGLRDCVGSYGFLFLCYRLWTGIDKEPKRVKIY
ncbi:MAG: TetR/AcrR family transcriptional regulator [Pseudomonadota bacterium]|nr:TetR/AcrR family transcriptional regulator [Pseudomonadota bacterium]